MEKFWTVLEIQRHDNGALATLANAYENYPQAQSAYYSILAAAAISTLPYHAAYLMDDTSGIDQMQIFDRRGE